MVSTTLTTIAAGQQQQHHPHHQQQSTSSNHHHHQYSQHHYHTTTTSGGPSTAYTANNSNYQRSTSALTTTTTTTTRTHHSSTSGNGNRAYANAYNNNAASLTSNGSTTLKSLAVTSSDIAVGGGNTVNEHNHNYHQQKATHNGGGHPIVTPPTATAKLQRNCNESSSTEAAAASAFDAKKPIVNLTHALLAGVSGGGGGGGTNPTTSSPPPPPVSPPLNDQISLLFPKCRPKQQQQHASHSVSANQASISDISVNSSVDEDVVPLTNYNGLSQRDRDTEASASLAAAPPTGNYYKSVNIITQSPPPPSTSSISSESLSSVTPRISTNPFLCANGDIEPPLEHVLTKPHKSNAHATDDDDDAEELPVPSYSSFYYRAGEEAATKRSTAREDSAKRVYEMPRKRSNYNNSYCYGQQQQQQQQHHHYPLSGGGASSANPQNPFMKEHTISTNNSGYWSETSRQHAMLKDYSNEIEVLAPDNAKQQQVSTSVVPPAAATTAPPPATTTASLSSSSRRAYHQQSYANGQYVPPRQQSQQQQQHLRVGRSPPKHQSDRELYDAAKRYHQQQLHQQQQQQHQKSHPCSEGLTPLASHYLYGSKTSLEPRDWPDKPRDREHRKAYTEREREWLMERNGGSRGGGTGDDMRQHHHPRDVHATNNAQANPEPGRLSSLISNGEVVVFDDITESWQNLRVTTDPSATANSPSLMGVAAAACDSSGVAATASSNSIANASSLQTLAEVEEKKCPPRSGENDVAYKDHKRYTMIEGSRMGGGDTVLNPYAITVETRHGIIEYEGSPRRIGGLTATGVLTPADEDVDERADVAALTPPPGRNKHAGQKAGRHGMATTPTTNTSSPQYPARPGFPQRIISPRRETSPPIMLLHQGKQPQQQHQNSLQSLPPQQQSPSDNNAEDTSNDVSEIGTISDLNTPPDLIAVSHSNEYGLAPAAASVTPTTAPTSTTASNTLTSAGIGGGLLFTTGSSNPLSIPTKSSTFDYLYEFSETRKVLEEFFKCPSNDDEKPIENGSDVDSIDIQYEFHSNLDRDDLLPLRDDDDEDVRAADGDNDDDDEEEDDDEEDEDEVHRVDRDVDEEDEDDDELDHGVDTSGQLQAPQYAATPYQQQSQQQQQQSTNNYATLNNHHNHSQRRHFTGSPLMRNFDFFLDSASRSSGEQIDQQIDGINHNHATDARTNYRYSPETTDYDSNCGDVDSLSGEINGVSTSCSNYAKFYASSMPVLEDGLSDGLSSDNENNNNNNNLNNSMQQQQQQQQQQHSSGIHHGPIGGGISMLMDMKRISTANSLNSMNNTMTASTTDGADKRSASDYSPNLMHDPYSSRKDDPSPINNGTLEDSGRESEHSRRDGRELLGQSPSNNSNSKVFKNIDPDLDSLYSISVFHRSDLVQMTPPPPAPAPHRKPNLLTQDGSVDILQPTPYKDLRSDTNNSTSPSNTMTTTSNSHTGTTSIASAISSTLNRSKSALSNNHTPTKPPQQTSNCTSSSSSLMGVRNALAQASVSAPPPIPERNPIMARSPSPVMNSPVWLPRHLDTSASKSLLGSSSADNHGKQLSADEDDVDTDLETDRLLGHQRLDDQGYYDENKSWESSGRKTRSSLLSKISPKQQVTTKTRNGYNALLSSTPEMPPAAPPPIPPKNSTNKLLDIGGSLSSSSEHSVDKSPLKSDGDDRCGVVVAMGGSPGGASIRSGGGLKKELDQSGGGVVSAVGVGSATNGGGGGSSVGSNSTSTSGEKKVKKMLIEGVLFRAKYLGSTQLVCEGQPTKSTRMMQAEEAVSRIKALAPDGDVQPSTEVDLFISTEKIMVLNTDLKEIMMDHALRTISYIADIGDLVVLMARRRFVPQDIDDGPKPNRTPKMICHVFESDEAQFIAQSIGQAFQVAYMEFLKANGIEDHSFVKEMDYQEVLNSQEIFGDELEIFAKKELQKEVVVPKAKGEILGVVIVESGWGSMLPTVVIANLMSSGAAARCGQLNIGDQLIAINGLSLVGLPLSTCQTYIKNTKNQTVVKFTVVPCAPVVEVKIKRPNTKYQLGFSVQNGVICSLLRGGIAERGGVRVGHRIIEINNQSVVAVPHEKIVNLLATSVGEILMKTMPTSMFRLLTGQENPVYI